MVIVNAAVREDYRLLIMQGHADYSPGNDIVCAGCSAVWYSLLGWTANMPEHVTVMDQQTGGEGNFNYIRATGDESFEAAFDMALIGLAQLAQKYPENVKVITL
ncbi:MAG: ribosomal-processing cysteine protease Prp [Clostridia bacterium]|nr:ribosomal-processing cysteine protease Prp [Clostridia bacterium]